MMKLILHIVLILASQSILAQVTSEYFGSAGEGYSASSQGGTIELGWRMFTAPMGKALCGEVNDEIKFVSSMPTIILAPGDSFFLKELMIDAIDQQGNFVERLPITVGLPFIDKSFLNYRPYDLDLTALKQGSLQIEITGYCVPTSRMYVSLTVTDKARMVSLGSFNITIPGEWLHETEAKSDQRVITTIYNPNGIGTLQFMSLNTAPKVVTQEILRNMTNVDSSITLNWQLWGDFSGYQYDYTENGTNYQQWWLANQEEILFFVYSSDSVDESERKVINGIVTSITAVN